MNLSLIHIYQLEVGIARNIHRIDGVERSFPRKQGVHIEVRGDHTADGSIVSEDILHIQSSSCDGDVYKRQAIPSA